MEQEQQKEQYNLLKLLNRKQQAELIHAMNDFLGNLDLRLTEDPYFQFTCTIDQDGDLVLLPNDMKLTWIDLKQLIPTIALRQLKNILEQLFQGKGITIVTAIREQLGVLFDLSQRKHQKSHGGGHIVGSPDAFEFRNLSPKLRFQILELIKKRIHEILGNHNRIVHADTKNQLDIDHTVLAHINHMLGPKRSEYFSMDKEGSHKLHLNRKGCLYLSRLYREVFQRLVDSKGFFDLKFLYGESSQYSYIQKLLAGKDLTDKEIVSLISSSESLIQQSKPDEQDLKKAQFGTINDLVYAAHYAYHTNRFDFFELQIAPEMEHFKEKIAEGTQSIEDRYKNPEALGGYVLFHEIAPLKDLVSASIKSLRGKDRIFDIMRGRTVMHEKIFDRKQYRNRKKIKLEIASVFSSVNEALIELCKNIGMRDVSIRREYDNKYNNMGVSENIPRMAFGEKSFILRKSSKKKTEIEFEKLIKVGENLGLETGLVKKYYRALSETTTGALDGYEDMKVIFTVSGYDRFGQPIEFGYEHMVVFSDYSNENPRSSHMMKLDPHKVVNGLTREAGVSSQREFYSLHLAGVKSFVMMMQEREIYLEKNREKKLPYKGKYPYEYIADQFSKNNTLVLDNKQVILFSHIDFEKEEDMVLVNMYIAQSFREFMQQGKHHLFVRTKVGGEHNSNIEKLGVYEDFGKIVGEGSSEDGVEGGEIKHLDSLLLGLDQEDLRLLEQTNGNMMRQLVTMTLPRAGMIGMHIDGKIHWVSVSDASYLMRMLHPVADEKFAWNFDTSKFEKKSKPQKLYHE